MISDDSSSDSETGRFKSSDTKRQDGTRRSTNQRERLPSSGRSRPSDNDRFVRNFNRRRDERDRYERPREGHRPSRPSPVRERRRYSRERSHDRRRRSHERLRPMPMEHRGHDRERSSDQRPKNTIISTSKDRKRPSPIKSNKPPEPRRDFKDEIKRNIAPSTSKEECSHKYDRARSQTRSSSPELKNKRSVVQKPASAEPPKRKAGPITVDKQLGSDLSDEPVQAGSYYSMIPAVVKEKEKSVEKEKEKEVSEESSEIDSSDDERLRAKLLNLEKEISKTRKKKHKKKHRRKSSKPKKEEDRDKSTSVEVTSTTDIQESKLDEPKDVEIVEVTSTQKSNQKESSEEGEISSGDDSQGVEYDSTDLRHKLKRAPAERSRSPDLRERLSARVAVCGPALPPHLDKRRRASVSPGHEGPALPPHLMRKEKNIGPSIPNDMRKVLADREVVKYESSDEDLGIGPLPASAQDKWTDAHKKLEERALGIKIKDLDRHTMQMSDVKSREKWMLELPEGKAKIIGLEARSFRAKAGPDMSDRSSWTDTPEQKARKVAGLAPEEDRAEALRREAHNKYVEKRDSEQEREARKHKKKHKRDESLLDMHEKKLKKKKKKEERDNDGRKERRPFSRDVDLQVNRFDEAQKQSIVKKAQHLDSRFSRGEAKYL